VKRISGKCY